MYKTGMHVDENWFKKNKQYADRQAEYGKRRHWYTKQAYVRERGGRTSTLAFQMARYRSLQKGRDTDKCNIINAEHTHNTRYL